MPLQTIVKPVRAGSRLEIHIQGEAIPISYEWSGAAPEPRNDDYALLGALSYAMQRGGRVHVQGRVDQRLLANAEKFSELWAAYRPDLFKQIEVSADEDLEPRVGDPGGAYAFALSGGVDSVFSLMRNSEGADGRTSRKPACAFLMEWSDARHDPAWAPALRGRAARIAEVIGVSHLVCRTNWREFCRDFDIEHPLGILAAAHCLNGAYEGCVLAADHFHRDEVALGPWGNNHATNPLLSSSGFEAINYGGAFERLEKVRLLAHRPDLVANLAVCTRPRSGENCGRCEKCLRSGLELFVTSGSTLPVTQHVPSFNELAYRKPLSRSSLMFWRGIMTKWPEGRAGMSKLGLAFLIARSELQHSLVLRTLQSVERRIGRSTRSLRGKDASLRADRLRATAPQAGVAPLHHA
ncbi:hypothetical protein [Vitreimonas sp.]|uniref:hypothetical protein n=1 Tax=Vitreimonas sp. TaxID=3069702 RepID=UPI002EDBB384